jgi:hypothetical protein
VVLVVSVLRADIVEASDCTYLWYVYVDVVVEAVKEDVTEYGDTSPTHTSAAVDQHGGVAILTSSNLAYLDIANQIRLD